MRNIFLRRFLLSLYFVLITSVFVQLMDINLQSGWHLLIGAINYIMASIIIKE